MPASSPFGRYWDLDPDCTYLNHGSFGPSPKCVREVREQWSRRLEQQPMRFFCQEMEAELENAAAGLAEFVGTTADRLALIDNATFAMNVAAASIDLKPEDEVLLTDHEYGAVRKIWQNRCRESGAMLRTVSLPIPLDNDGVVAAIEQRLNRHTRVVVTSHVTSPTAAVLPVQRVCELARKHGIISIIDGPHALVTLDLQLDQLNCDFYCGSCHKWLCAPFGSGFLYVHPHHHPRVRCPVISWGGSISGRAATWKDPINWLGTRDPAAFLAISSAIEFLEQIGIETFRRHTEHLITTARSALLQLDGIGPLCTTEGNHCVSMCSVELPQPEGWVPGYHGRADALQLELRREYGIEVPVGTWNGRRYLRVSAHLYNDEADMLRLIDALR